MDSNIVNKLYEFPVEKRLLYFPVEDKYGNVTYNDCLVEDKNKVMCIIRTDTNTPLGVCSEKYQIITHGVVKDYSDRLIQNLGYKVSSAKLELPNKGSTMLYYNILDDQMYSIGDSRIKAAIECKNSYNGTENASINVVFVNEQNTILGFGFKKESRLANSVFIKHHGKAEDKVQTEFGGLIEYIPDTIKKTVTLWNVWENQHVDGNRIKLICRAISAGFAKYCQEFGLFDTGCSRFEFYSYFCKYNLNLGTIGKYYRSQKLQIAKMNNLFLFESNPAFAIKMITKLAKFDYDELGNPNVKTIKNSRTFLAMKNDTVNKDYQVNMPEKVEQIVEDQPKPEVVVESPVPVVESNTVHEPVEEVIEEDDPNKLIEGW